MASFESWRLLLQLGHTVLYGGLGIGKLQFLIKKKINFFFSCNFFSILVIKALDPDWIRIRIRKKWIRIRNTVFHCPTAGAVQLSHAKMFLTCYPTCGSFSAFSLFFLLKCYLSCLLELFNFLLLSDSLPNCSTFSLYIVQMQQDLPELFQSRLFSFLMLFSSPLECSKIVQLALSLDCSNAVRPAKTVPNSLLALDCFFLCFSAHLRMFKNCSALFCLLTVQMLSDLPERFQTHSWL